MDFHLTDADKLAYFQQNFFTLDGLWMVVLEEHLGLEETIKIDLQVWEHFFPVIYRRIARYLKIRTQTVEDFVRILGFRWTAEGWDFKIEEVSPTSARVTINKGGCPYHAGLLRANRPDKMPRICNDVCDRLYEIAANSFNPAIKVRRTKRQGINADTCDFIFEILEAGQMPASPKKAKK